MLYNVALVSAVQQFESVMRIYISPLLSLPPIPPHPTIPPSRASQSARLLLLQRSFPQAILHIVAYTCHYSEGSRASVKRFKLASDRMVGWRSSPSSAPAAVCGAGLGGMRPEAEQSWGLSSACCRGIQRSNRFSPSQTGESILYLGPSWIWESRVRDEGRSWEPWGTPVLWNARVQPQGPRLPRGPWLLSCFIREALCWKQEMKAGAMPQSCLMSSDYVHDPNSPLPLMCCVTSPRGWLWVPVGGGHLTLASQLLSLGLHIW